MRLIGKLFFIVGIAFWSIGLLYSFSKLVALNGLVKIFNMKEAQDANTEIIRDSTHVKILYAYWVNGKVYEENYRMVVDYFDRYNPDTIIIKYNKLFPMVSYVDGIPLKIRQQKIQIFISTFFLLFLILLWKLSNRDKWVATYEDIPKRPWLYQADKSIKNPFKRFKSRLFRQ